MKQFSYFWVKLLKKMGETENINIAAYLRLIKNLNLKDKMAIISFLSESVIDKSEKEIDLFDLYRKFISNKDAETIINEIHDARKFNDRGIQLWENTC